MRLPTGVKTTGAVAVGEGRGGNGRGHVISRRFQYAEVDEQGNVRDPGPEPYLGYEPASKEQIAVLRERLDLNWVDVEAEGMARDWAIENMAGRHLERDRESHRKQGGEGTHGGLGALNQRNPLLGYSPPRTSRTRAARKDPSNQRRASGKASRGLGDTLDAPPS